MLFVSVVCFTLSCKNESPNLRSLAPQETLIYLETNDLGEIFSAFKSSQSWETFAQEKPIIPALSGIQAAVAITGFETSESDVSLNVKPKFVVILDTNSYETTTISVIENQISKFLVNAKLKKTKKNNVTFLTWTTVDNRKIIAAIIGNLAFIGNDESSINDFLAVKNGEKPSLLTNETLIELASQKKLAFGFVSKKGVNEIANFLSIRVAIQTSEQDIVRSLIAKILPNVVDKSIEEITWTANKSVSQIEDKFLIKLKPEVAKNLADSMETSKVNLSNTFQAMPINPFSTTIYNFKSNDLAFQGLIRTLGSQTDQISGKLIENFSQTMLQSYGISDNKKFFEAIEGNILTAQLDSEGEESFVVVNVKDVNKLKSAVIKDKEFGLKIIKNVAILGDAETVSKVELGENIDNIKKITYAVTTITDETEFAKSVIRDFAEIDPAQIGSKVFATTNSNVNTSGIERFRQSEYGLFGDFLKLAKQE